jgi:hypothetical protein
MGPAAVKKGVGHSQVLQQVAQSVGPGLLQELLHVRLAEAKAAQVPAIFRKAAAEKPPSQVRSGFPVYKSLWTSQCAPVAHACGG